MIYPYLLGVLLTMGLLIVFIHMDVKMPIINPYTYIDEYTALMVIVSSLVFPLTLMWLLVYKLITYKSE